ASTANCPLSDGSRIRGEIAPVPGEAGRWMKWNAFWKRPDAVFAWGLITAGFAGRAVVFFIPPAEVPPAVLIARRDLLKMKTGFTFLS
ncbi:hypothetical protein, partial [uncultured Akkermansia sp.]|uniref:hypothetical protein n=2 Tax=Akkermansia TaxID=239934 RepID=UPI0026255CD1